MGRKPESEQYHQNRRASIVDAFDQVVTDRGILNTRIEDVARAANIAPGTIYLHFADKQALVEEWISKSGLADSQAAFLRHHLGFSRMGALSQAEISSGSFGGVQ